MEGIEESAPQLRRHRVARDLLHHLAEEHVVRVRVVPAGAGVAIRRRPHVVQGVGRCPGTPLVGEDRRVDVRVREEVVQAARVVEQLADRHAAPHARRRQPPKHRIVERQPVLVRELEDEGGEERLRDAADRERRARDDRHMSLDVGPAVHADPAPAIRPDDRDRHARHVVLHAEGVQASLECGGRDRGGSRRGRWRGRRGRVRRRDRRRARIGRGGDGAERQRPQRTARSFPEADAGSEHEEPQPEQRDEASDGDLAARASGRAVRRHDKRVQGSRPSGSHLRRFGPRLHTRRGCCAAPEVRVAFTHGESSKDPAASRVHCA